MSRDHAKKEMETSDKPTASHGKATSEESCNKGKEKKTSSHKSRRSRDKKKEGSPHVSRHTRVARRRRK
jgi:hypothetical protein